MTLEYGLLLGIIGTTTTVVGFLIAFYVAARVIQKEKIRVEKLEEKKKHPTYGLFKDDTC